MEYYQGCSTRSGKEKMTYLIEKVQNVTHSVEGLSIESKKLLSRFVNQYKYKFLNCRRNKTYFEKKEKVWLNSNLAFPIEICSSKRNGGRPAKSFSESSERSKRRKTKDLRSQNEAEVLQYATQMKLRADGKLNTAKIVKTVTEETTITQKPTYRQYTPDEALGLVIGAKLTKYQYNLMRQGAIDHNCNIYPNYEAVTQSKKKCYPENMSITEASAEISLQALLDHTAKRLFQSLNSVISSLAENQLENLCMVTKWGCDGTSGQAEYKQLFQNESVSDESIFLISIVPIHIVSGNLEDNSNIIWKNPTASSPRYCRPLKMFFAKETADLIRKEVQLINEQIASLAPTEIEYNMGKHVMVRHHLILSMIDGKTVNAITDTSSHQRCYLCGETSKNFNNISLCLSKQVQNKKYLDFGISPLHGWIRLFECLLHVSYKLPINKWQARTKEEKQKVEIQKKHIQDQFRIRLGLLVDKPKPGFGSSNDGNTARRFFHNYEESAKITGIDNNIIYRFYIILLALTSSFTINVTKFKEFCLETATFLFSYIHGILCQPQSIKFYCMAGKL